MSERSYMGGSNMAPSVGEAIADRAMFMTDHPQYKLLAEAVTSKLAQVSAERALARAANRAVPVSVSLTVAESNELASQYPEFSFVNYSFFRPGHSMWVQARRLGNEWMMTQAKKYTNKTVHLGGSVVSYLMHEGLDSSLLVDMADPVSVHERHEHTVESFRYFSDFAAVGEDLGRPLDRMKYEKYLRGELLPVHAVTGPLPQADVMIVDLTLTLMAPVQVASMMLESGSLVCFGMFVYTPEMIMAERGTFGETGVSFVKETEGVRIQYPEGAAGETFLGYSNWEPWLVSHTFPIGNPLSRKYYQVELLKQRGSFMFFRMTALPCAPSSMDITHALDVNMSEPMYVVTVPMLSRAGDDPTDPANWQTEPFTASQRVVDRAYNDAMQLKREQFTIYNVRKKITDANDRMVINGTKVQVNSPMGLDVVQRLAMAIASRAFVDRYDAGRLTQEVMAVSRKLMRETSVSDRVSALVGGLCTRVYSRVDGALAVVGNWLDATFHGEGLAQPGTFQVPLGYVRVGERCTALTHGLRVCGPEVLVARARPVRGMPGFSIAEAAVRSTVGRTVGTLQDGWAQMKSVAVSRIASAMSAGGHIGRSDTVKVATSVPAASDAFAGLGGYRVSEQALFEEVEHNELADRLVNVAGSTGYVEHAGDKFNVTATVPEGERASQRVHVDRDPDPVGSFNAFYAAVNPGVAPQELEQDTASLSLDPQDRYVTADRLVLPTAPGLPPATRSVYKSKIEALNVSKRQGTLPELLSATSARNLSAPQVSLPQDEDAAVKDIWDRFLAEACVGDARAKLARYVEEPVALTEEGLRGWAAQTDEKKIIRVCNALEECAELLESMDVGEYMMMLKADVKPDLTTKPIFNRIEPQVIVYHKAELNALYSSIFRVLVRRFMSLLKPNYKVILMKDMGDAERVLQAIHPFGVALKYLENDFSKYDKSQGRFVFLLEAFVFRQLGLNEALLEHWLGGHVTSRIRSVALGMSLHVDYQRKSGDATTAFGNVLLNILSVTYAYAGTQVVWALFIGDDSLVACTEVAGDRNAVRVLAEVFNLGAKTYVTQQPYFASNFLMVDDANAVIRFLPDPVKRIARWSMSVGAEEPMWHERWVSARDACSSYLDEFNVSALPALVAARYDVLETLVGPAVRAVATVIESEEKFRGIWFDKPEVVTYG